MCDDPVLTGFSEITYRVKDSVATIALNRPAARNGYTVTMADELEAAFDRADLDDEVRAVVLTGKGKDFCVGADLKGGFDAEQVYAGAEDSFVPEPAGRCAMRVFAMRKPVIAAVVGAAVGAGSTIMLPADYRIVAEDSRFGFVFTRRGIVPEAASTWFLPRLVGMGKALDWMVSGRLFGAEEALQAGLVSEVLKAELVLPRALALAAELASTTAPVAVALTRQMLYRMGPHDSPQPVQRLDSRLIAAMSTSQDATEGVLSFLERRLPKVPGRVGTVLPDGLPWDEVSWARARS
jgi:enoyl-CoA hydratase/carnithine racemase